MRTITYMFFVEKEEKISLEFGYEIAFNLEL